MSLRVCICAMHVVRGCMLLCAAPMMWDGGMQLVVHPTQARRRQQVAKKAISRGVNLAGSSETTRKISCTCCPSRSCVVVGWRSSIGCMRRRVMSLAADGLYACATCMHAFSVVLGCWERACDARSSAQITSYATGHLELAVASVVRPYHMKQAQVRKYRAEIGSRTSAYDKSYDRDFAFPCQDKDTFSHLATRHR